MNDVAQKPAHQTISVAGVEIEIYERGQGAAIFYLHGGGGIAPDIPFLEQLAKTHRVVAPSHPGFGRSSLPDWIDSVDDIAHIHLEVMDRVGLDKADIVGMSLGGWIAGEIATKIPERVKRLVLIGPVGVKTGSQDKLDIPDVFATPDVKLQKLLFHDPEKWRPDVKAMSDEQIGIMVRNRETMALIGWEPYLHNPKLPHRLHRVTNPTLLLRGESDGLVSAEYLDRYAKLFPNARITTIAKAGHAPQIEQMEATAKATLEFLQ